VIRKKEEKTRTETGPLRKKPPTARCCLSYKEKEGRSETPAPFVRFIIEREKGSSSPSKGSNAVDGKRKRETFFNLSRWGATKGEGGNIRFIPS